MPRKYDLAVSLGGACACSKSLRKAEMQFTSFPFDWLNGATLHDRVDIIAGDFKGWLSAGLEKIPEPPLCVGESHWRELKYGFGLLHDFDRITPMEAALPTVKEKYARRAARMYELIGRANHILWVWTDVPTSPEATDDDLKYMLEAFHKKWPNKICDVLVFKRRVGVPIEDKMDVERGPVRTVAFEYMIQEISKYGVLLADDELLGKWLASQYEVPDYRTPAEIARWKRISKMNRYKEFGGHDYSSYLIGKFQYKIYKHLMKQLQRKGIQA